MTRIGSNQASPDKSQHLGEHTHGSNFRFEFGDRTLSVIALNLATAAIIIALCSMLWADFSRRHVEELRIRIENAENTLIIAGLRKPRDAENGPEANPDRLKKEH